MILQLNYAGVAKISFNIYIERERKKNNGFRVTYLIVGLPLPTPLADNQNLEVESPSLMVKVPISRSHVPISHHFLQKSLLRS